LDFGADGAGLARRSSARPLKLVSLPLGRARKIDKGCSANKQSGFPVGGNNDLPGQLQKVVFRLNRELRASASPAGISASDAVLLSSLLQTPGLGVSELAQEENVGRSVMSERVKRLEVAGLVCREVAPPQGDRRRVGLTITPAGRKALTEIKALRRAWMNDRVAHLSDQDRRILEAAVEILLRFDQIPVD
jgi:DNA-binding MarR family transcriptional regulator